MDSLSSDHKEKVDEFKSITGSSTDSENDDKIIEFLTVHDFDLNNAISTYFDSGFDSIGNSSAINQHDEIDKLRPIDTHITTKMKRLMSVWTKVDR